jgi:hypothetical protein
LKAKDFLIGTAIISIATFIFCFPTNSLDMVIPSLLFAGVLSGLYVGYQRKRPLIYCMYDGLVMGLPASLIQGVILIPILWFLQGIGNETQTPLRFITLWLSASIMLGGLVGAPFGGLLMGLFYRYLIKDRGEKELYDTYLEEKTSDKKKKKQELMD